MHRKFLPGRIATLFVAGLTLVALSYTVARNHQKNATHEIVTQAASTAANQPTPALQKQDVANAYGKLPMAFEPNQGQTDPRVRYLSHGTGYELFLTNQEAVLTLQQHQAAGKADSSAALLASRSKTPSVVKTSVLRMRFEGSNSTPKIAGTNPLPGKINYFIGNDPAKWHTDIPSYGAVRYKNVYPGVDAVFYGNQQRLEYDFVVAPGADPKAIVLNIEGARKLGVNSRGDLMIGVARGGVALQKPVVYQEINGERREIAANYVIADHHVRFSLADYDRTQPLTIDPVLNYSTYIGGESLDYAQGIALDAAGDAYIAGLTFSTMYPQQNPESTTPPSDIAALGTAFVSELNPTGSALLYSTYLGGSGNSTAGFGDQANGIAVDAATPLNIYVTGFTYSTDFPVSTTPLAPLQATFPTGNTGETAFITKLTPSATGSAQLAYSSYLGGNTQDDAQGIAVDTTGNAYIAGETASSNFPTMGTPVTTGLKSAAGNAFLTKINTTASGAASLVYSTYLGGTAAASTFLFSVADIAFGVTIDTNSNAYVVGGTASTDFPTAGTAINSATCGANGNGSAFISVINTTNGNLGYSQCLTGSSQEYATSVSLGTGVPAVTTKVAYITGQTFSANFPVTSPSIPVGGGSVTAGVAFVSLVNTNSTTPLQYSTFLGGNNGDTGYSIGSDALGNAYVVGTTASSDFPVTPGALQTVNNNPNNSTAFVSKIGPNGLGMADLIYSTYYGGQTLNNTLTEGDFGFGLAVSGTNAYITGSMAAPDMLVSSTAFQKMLGAGATANAFVADLPMVAGISVSPTFINFGTQAIGVATAPQTVTVTNNSSTTVTFTSIAVVPISPAAPATDFAIASGSNTCGASIAGGRNLYGGRDLHAIGERG